MTFFDTNVVLDILTDDPVWAEWSIRALVDAPAPLRISGTVYAELAGCYEAAPILDGDLRQLRLAVADPSRGALFAAGRAHAGYRARGGARDRVLPDFLIGAHALTENAVLVTRDLRRYRTAFPELRLVSPD